MRAKYPFFYPKNIWPTAALPELEPAFKRLGTLMFKATVLLTQQIDALVAAKVSTYPKTFLFDNIVDTQKVRREYCFPHYQHCLTLWKLR